MAESTSLMGVFPGIFHTRQRKRTRRFVRKEDVDPLQRLTGVDLLVYKMTSPVVSRRKAPKLARRLLVPRRRERPSQPGERQTVRLHGNTVGDVVQVRQRTAAGRLRGHEIEVFVVAFDPVERRARMRILAIFGRKVAGANPERDLGMTRHDAIERIEVAVKITDGAE